MVGTIKDITSRKLNEQEIKNSEQRLSQIINFLPDPTFVIDRESKVLAWNQAIAEWTGVEASKILGKGNYEYAIPFRGKRAPMLIDLLFQRDETIEKSYLKLTQRGEKLLSESYIPGFRPGGVFLAGNAQPLYDASGEVMGAIETIRDITDLKRTEEALQKARQEADNANRAKSDFLANMSHEIRTPMNAIIGMAYLLNQTKLTSKQQDYLSKVNASAKSLLGIINDILDFSKIEAGKLEMESVVFKLDEVLEGVTNLVSLPSHEKGLELFLKTDSDVPARLTGDPLRLGQVLTNLVNNAIKFTERGEVVLAIGLLEKNQNRIKLKFSVSDTGIGMTEEKISRLFQPFSQADTSTTRKYGGTGLGLTICKRIVEMMGGEIWVESEAGNGSKFSFTADFRPTEQVHEKPLVPSPDMHGMSVLVVDDNATSRNILKRMLEAMSFEVSLAASGDEGLTELENADSRQPFDLVIMDWQMPGMDGIEASIRIKESLPLTNIPKIIMVTAYSLEEVMDRTKQIELEGFLIKPLSASVLYNTIMHAFNRKSPEYSRQSVKDDKMVKKLKSIRGAWILLVEDNEINQQVAREILERAGFPVSIASNGEEAIRAVKERNYEAVLMDIQIPEMDGYQVTNEIRKDMRFRKLPIIAMTAHAMTGDRERCLKEGMNDYLSKPIDPEKLFSTLIKWISPGERAIPDHLVLGTDKKSIESEGPPLSDRPGISAKSCLTKLGGNQNLYRKLLTEFRYNHSDAASDIQIALDKDDLDTAIRLAHTVKGVAGNIGANRLHSAAADLEVSLKQNHYNKYLGLLNAFSEALDMVLDSIADLKLGESNVEKVRSSIHPSFESMDHDRVASLLRELREFLEKDDTRSAKTIEALREAIPTGINDEELTELKKYIEGFSFEDALDTLSVIEKQTNGKGGHNVRKGEIKDCSDSR